MSISAGDRQFFLLLNAHFTGRAWALISDVPGTAGDGARVVVLSNCNDPSNLITSAAESLDEVVEFDQVRSS